MPGQNSLDFVPTKSSVLRRIQPNDFKVVVYKSHTKHKVNKSKKDVLQVEKKIMTDIDMKKARFEVYKFSKSKLDFSNKQKSNLELAIQLGAIPPKEKGKNYKELKIERLKQKEAEKEEAYLKNIQQNFTQLKKRSKPNTKKSNFRKRPDGILGTYGKVKKSIIP